MALMLRPLSDVMGVEVLGLDLTRPMENGLVAELNAAFHDGLVLCIRDQSFTPPQYLAASRCFGEPQMQLLRQWWHPEVNEISIVSSENKDGAADAKPIVRGPYWHTDDSYMARPAAATILYGIDIPAKGGDTRFCNMYAVYETLPAATRARIDGLTAVHKYVSRRAGAKVARRSAEEERETPDVEHPLVRTHPATGRKSLYINPNRIDHIKGMDLAESDALLDELYAHAFQPRFHYHHKWRKGDMVIWDNRCTMHAATSDLEPGQTRRLHRILLKGTVPV